VHPAFSVIFFTTASGAGFGALAWLGLLALAGALPPRPSTLIALALGAGLSAAGLLSSLAHLGQPQRAWMAFSQWRSSWLSREGVFATLTFVPAAALAWLAWTGPLREIAGVDPAYLGLAATLPVRVAGALLAGLALASVFCTAMIYASLKPIPAWRHPLVVPVYLLFSLLSGGLLVAAVVGVAGGSLSNMAGFGIVAGALSLWAAKRRAWRYIDEERAPLSRNEALGLPHARPVQVFERPHTEANYLLKEMGYVLARKHAHKLRLLAALLFALLPALLSLPLWLLPHFDANGPLLALALLSMLAGALVERWLFFAEARHLVTLYY
jgi:sulfite dehydrogenase (quinone) subunit SoeC